MKRVAVDLDGVLVDFDKQLADLLDKPLKRGWDFGDDPKVWKKIKDAGEDFWTSMSWMPDGHELWNYIKKLKPTVLTAPTKEPSSKTGKKLWMKNNLPRVPYIIDSQKHKHAKKGYILIDDREKNIRKWEEAGGIGILHKGAKSTIKKLEGLMSDKKADMEKEAINKLHVLSNQLKIMGRIKESSHVSRVADKWEDFLRSQGQKGPPGTAVMDWSTHQDTAQKGPVKLFFPDRILVNLALDTLTNLRDQKASIIAEKIRELNKMDVNDPGASAKKIELMKNAEAYSPDVGSLISTLLSLRYDNRDKFKIRETESEMKRLSRKIVQNSGGMAEERPSLFGVSPVRPIKKDPFAKYAETAKNSGILGQFDLKKAIIDHIDRIASQIESAGMLQEAYALDIIANTLEKEAGLDLAGYLVNLIEYMRKGKRSVQDLLERKEYGLKQWPLYSRNKKLAYIVAWKEALSRISKNPEELLQLVLSFKLDSKDLELCTIPVEEWAGVTGTNPVQFTTMVNESASAPDSESPPSNEGNPVKVSTGI